MAKMNLCEVPTTVTKNSYYDDSDVESSESSGGDSLFDDQSRESSFAGDDVDEFFSDDSSFDESSFVSHGIPLASSSCGGSVSSIESALPSNGHNSSLSLDGSSGALATDFSSGEESDYVVAVNMEPVKQSSKKRDFGKKKGSRSPSENSLDGSCHSIKDLLAIDSIHEHKQSKNDPQIMEYKFDDNGDLMVAEMNNLLSKIVQSTQNMEMGQEGTNSGGGKKPRPSKKSMYNDPLMSKYLNRGKKKKTKSSSSAGNGAISSILGSSDSLQHIKGSKNKRVVGTKAHIIRKQEPKKLVLDSNGDGEEFAEFNMPIKDIGDSNAPPQRRRGPTSATMKKMRPPKRVTPTSTQRPTAPKDDPLMQRYMSLRKNAVGSATANSGTLHTCDSLSQVAGKGNRVVKTRARSTATAF